MEQTLEITVLEIIAVMYEKNTGINGNCESNFLL